MTTRLLLCIALLCSAARVHAEVLPTAPSSPVAPEENGPPVGWAMGAGAAVALVPFAVGASLFASNYDPGRRRIAALTMAYGVAIAPLVSHLVVREWDRAGIFAAIPLACAIGITVLVEVQPEVTFYGTREGRWAYGLIMSAAVLSAGVGLADTLGARGRWVERKKSKKLALPVLPAPFIQPGGGGVTVGGVF